MPIYRVPVELANASLPSSAYNIWHLRTTDAGIDPGPAVAALRTWYDALKGNLASGTTVKFPVSLVEVTAQTEKEVGSPSADVVATGGSAGPPGLALTISWKTSIRARRGRGRTFLGPLTNTVIASNGAPSTTFTGAVTTATTTLVNDSAGNANGWALGIYGQESAGLVEPKVLRDITGFQLGPKFAHLRTRRD